MSHVFISYSRKDSEFVDWLVGQLEAQGIACWIDREDIKAGERWVPAIEDAILQSYAVVVVISPNSIASQYVTYEWAFAILKGREIIPLIYSQEPMPTDWAESKPHPRLRDFNYLSMVTTNSRDMSLGKAVERIKELREKPMQPSTEELEKAKVYRDHRIRAIKEGTTPKPLSSGAKIVLHLIPVDQQLKVSLQTIRPKLPILGYLKNTQPESRIFIQNGLIATLSSAREKDVCDGYAHVMPNGVIEVVDLDILSESSTIPPRFEEAIREIIPNLMALFADYDRRPRLILFLNLLGVAGYKMYTGDRREPRIGEDGHGAIDHDDIILDGIELGRDLDNLDQYLKPLFDQIWNAAHWPSSRNYDAEGKWNPIRQR